jgi:hypothetical protein
MPNAYPFMFNEWQTYWRASNGEQFPNYQQFKTYTTELAAFCHAYLGTAPRTLPPIEAALEQFRIGARASADGGNPEQNIAFARGDPAPAAVAAAVAILNIMIPPPDPIVLKFKKFGLDAPADFNCPIAGDIMVQPVFLINSGNTYDSTSIETWKAMDPLTNVRMPSMATTPNLIMKSMIIVDH